MRQQGCFLLGDVRGNLAFTFSTSRRCLHSLACGHITLTPVSIITSFVTWTLLSTSSKGPCGLHLALSDNPG